MNLPKCSIVIPLLNDIARTRRCLEAIIEHTPDELYEVVLVDIGSTDETAELLAQLEGDVIILRDETLVDFEAACRQGVAASSTDLLLFLHQDAPAQDGWLESLLEEMDASPKMGAVVGTATLIRRAAWEQMEGLQHGICYPLAIDALAAALDDTGWTLGHQIGVGSQSSGRSDRSSAVDRSSRTYGYIIYSPPFSPSGGVRALHRLCDDLRAHGLPAAIHPMLGPYRENPYDAPSIEGQPAAVFRDAWHLYPEIVAGNPSGGERVIRWMLGPQRHDPAPTDRVYTWDHAITADFPRLQVPIVDLNVFHPGRGQRTGVVRWVGKGLAGPVPDGTIEITQSWPQSRSMLGEIFRSVDYLISNDPFSALNLEATLCGTPVLVDFRGWGPAAQVAAGIWDQKRVADSLFGDDGFAWSPEQLDEARERARSVFYNYVEMSLPAMAEDLRLFMEATQTPLG